jgi:anti-sigma28 factor (negative regulator of flagellin synthesis)
MFNKLPQSPDIDNHRINIIRTQLDEDAYIVNSRQIADKIIDIELALSIPKSRAFTRHSS